MKDEILNMQIRVIRQYAKKTDQTPKECFRIFKTNGIFEYIRSCYDLLHLNGDDCVVSDVMNILQTKGGAS